MKEMRYLITLLFLACNLQVAAQNMGVLKQKIQQIVSTKKAVVGISIIGNDGKDTLSLHGDRHFPLQSVFKFHIACVVLSQIDAGKFTLDQKIEVKPTELLPTLWSPLREENPQGGSFSIARLIQYAVSQSDNVSCDVLLRLLGGTKVVEDYFHKNNFKDISIKINEEEMQANWDAMFKNWTTPKEAGRVLKAFYNKKSKLLSKKSYDFIWRTMKETETGQNRLKGGLPKGTVIAHKTGSSGTNKEGVTEAVNDIGIVLLPNGKYFIISVFVTNSTENEETNEKIIADIAQATWDYYTTKGK
jgi:beta-lactamase class A/beta-lactamase class A VEB